MKKQIHKLNQFFATAICGNDILSSALYVSGIAALFAGMYAPLVLLLVGVVLLLYRSVYQEVVEALPVNGGAYNALLNSTSKIAASVAGTMTALSYLATVVISAKTGVEYLLYFLSKLFGRFNLGFASITFSSLIIPLTIGVMLAFALLVIAGVRDSAKVAAGIFSFHIITLTLFVLAGVWYVIFFGGGAIAASNWVATEQLVATHGGLWQVLFFGFSVSLLGISGFESSADFVEEQAPGVFRKTLRNMTAGVMVFNPLIAMVTLLILPLAQIVVEKDFVLGAVGYQYGGLVMLGLIGIDAFLVLCGAVLTGYIGVSGLINRMAMDNVLPSFLAKKNDRGSYPRIVLMFFLLCSSILLLTRGNLLSLAGVYTISFLSVMTLFAIGNLVLRLTRPELKRSYQASVVVVMLAALTTMVGLIGRIEADTQNVLYFLVYFVPTFLVVLTMIFKKDFYKNMRRAFTVIPIGVLRRYFARLEDSAENIMYYVFLHHSKNIFRALEYVHHNEGGRNITFVHCGKGDKGEHEEIKHVIPVLKLAGVFPHFRVKFKYVKDSFSPQTIHEFARHNNIPLNYVFIGSIHDSHEFEYREFGGVRIILE
ncbi:MAG: APC family permease [Candidatus Magasanikbacteria bacterium]|nr:APC family permease [Candidatus Magasanikbacteria bacterium]